MTEELGLHFELAAYICGPGDVRPGPFDAPVMYQKIFNARPDRARFAVVQRVPLKQGAGGAIYTSAASGDFLVWDFYATHIAHGAALRERGLLPPPEARWRHPSRDAMIMKAMALYDKV